MFTGFPLHCSFYLKFRQQKYIQRPIIRIVILASMECVCFRALSFPSIFLPHHIPHLSTNPDVFLRHKFELAR